MPVQCQSSSAVVCLGSDRTECMYRYMDIRAGPSLNRNRTFQRYRTHVRPFNFLAKFPWV